MKPLVSIYPLKAGSFPVVVNTASGPKRYLADARSGPVRSFLEYVLAPRPTVEGEKTGVESRIESLMGLLAPYIPTTPSGPSDKVAILQKAAALMRAVAVGRTSGKRLVELKSRARQEKPSAVAYAAVGWLGRKARDRMAALARMGDQRAAIALSAISTPTTPQIGAVRRPTETILRGLLMLGR